MAAAGIRVELDARNEKIGYKIREARNQRVSYLCVIGEQEEQTNALAVRSSKKGEFGAMDVEAFTDLLLNEIKSKALE